jgi:hypothetical protein
VADIRNKNSEKKFEEKVRRKIRRKTSEKKFPPCPQKLLLKR